MHSVTDKRDDIIETIADHTVCCSAIGWKSVAEI